MDIHISKILLLSFGVFASACEQLRNVQLPFHREAQIGDHVAGCRFRQGTAGKADRKSVQGDAGLAVGGAHPKSLDRNVPGIKHSQQPAEKPRGVEATDRDVRAAAVSIVRNVDDRVALLRLPGELHVKRYKLRRRGNDVVRGKAVQKIFDFGFGKRGLLSARSRNTPANFMLQPSPVMSRVMLRGKRAFQDPNITTLMDGTSVILCVPYAFR